MSRFKFFILTFFISLFSFITLSAQDWDYEKYPKLDIDISHLDAELRISETGEIEGDILYSVGFNITEVDSIVLDASRMDVSSVHINDTAADFEVDFDQLVIHLNNSYNVSDVINLRIQYATTPNFGLHIDEYGTVWTSLLPHTTRHWLPVIDHPRVSFTTEMVFTHPAGKTIVANGKLTGSEVLSVDEETTSYVSNRPLPASALAWSFGDMSEIASTSDSSQLNELNISGAGEVFQGRTSAHLNIFATTNNLDSSALLQAAVTEYLNIQEKTGLQFPFDELNIVVLDDHTWETKNYGAGTVFVYKGLGSLTDQVKMGVLSQWIGVHLRESQWQDADAILLLKAFYGDELEDVTTLTKIQYEPYHVFDHVEFLRWKNFVDDREMSTFKDNLNRIQDILFTDDGSVLDWDSFARWIYDETGQPFFDKFSPEVVEEEVSSADKIEYTAEMNWDESEGTLQITFNAINEPVNELVTVEAEVITFQDTNSHELTFTGDSDTVTLNVSSNVENVKLTISERDDIHLKEKKPFMFWIYQLRNDDDTERRKAAASGISEFDGNPDLQLALNDILQVESNPEVYAEILRSLSVLTGGASGTHERFIEMSSTQQHPEVQKAAVEALAKYPGNERVISRLRTVTVQTEDEGIRKAAINSLSEVTEPGRFRTLAADIITRESVLNEVPLLLSLLAEKGEVEAAVEFASTFVTPEFSYQTREQALSLLLEYDRNSGNWEERLPGLLADRDPRIRYESVKGLEIASSNRRQQLIRERLVEEYDERVRRALSAL